MSPQHTHGKLDFTLQSKAPLPISAESAQAEAGAHGPADKVLASSLSLSATESAGAPGRRIHEVERLAEQHPCARAAVEQNIGDRAQNFVRISQPRLAEMRESGVGSRTVTHNGNEALPPVLWRHDSPGSPVQRDATRGNSSPLYCTLLGRSSPARLAGRLSAAGGRIRSNAPAVASSKGMWGPNNGADKAPPVNIMGMQCRLPVTAIRMWPKILTSACSDCQAFESRVGGSNSFEGADLRRSEDEILQRLHRLVARGSNGVETSTPMMTRPRVALGARTQSSRGSPGFTARQSPGLVDLRRSRSSLPNSRVGGSV